MNSKSFAFSTSDFKKLVIEFGIIYFSKYCKIPSSFRNCGEQEYEHIIVLSLPK